MKARNAKRRRVMSDVKARKLRAYVLGACPPVDVVGLDGLPPSARARIWVRVAYAGGFGRELELDLEVSARVALRRAREARERADNIDRHLVNRLFQAARYYLGGVFKAAR
jgi:hypothetical protein